MSIRKIHHISNIVKHPQENIDFYAGMLGLRLIKKAVNFDNANTYHFYYGNHQADSGTVITSFPLGRDTKDGQIGGGMTSSTYYIIPKGSFDYWLERLTSFKVKTSIIERFGKKHLVFYDYLGIKSELVESDRGITNLYEFNGVTSGNAIKGFYGAELYSIKPEATKDFFIKYLNAKLKKESNDHYRLSYNSDIAGFIDISREERERGRLSKGTVHHIAFEIDTLENLSALEARLVKDGFKPSEIKDRNFFNALYVREPGGIIIEISTAKPGFDGLKIDRKTEDLFLPKHFEHLREKLELELTPVFVKEVSELKKYHYEGVEEYRVYERHQFLLRRINELAKISKERKLSNEESEEQKALRTEYLNNIKGNLSSLTSNIEYVDAFGHINKLNNKGAN